MNTQQEILKRLERLKRQLNYSIANVQPDRIVKHDPVYWQSPTTPNTFEIGDFIITDKQWTKCGCGEDGCKSQ